MRDVDTDGLRIFIHDGKGGKDRICPLPRFLAARVKEHLAKQKDSHSAYLFPGQKANTHLTPRAMQLAMRKAVESTGIKFHVTCHTMRHSFATWMLKNGVDIRSIQELFFFNDPQTTKIYTHVSLSHHTLPNPFDY